MAANCEWMFGDAATGILGFSGMASLNPLRWSGPVSFEKAIENMEECKKHGTRPVVLKVPAGISSKEQKFKDPESVIVWLKENDPKKKSLKEAAEHAQRFVGERELIFTEAQEKNAEAQTNLTKALEASGKAKMKKCEWMYGDAAKGMGGLFTMAARFNPTRWSGDQLYSRTIEDLTQLQKQQEELKEDARPIILKIPPGITTKEELFPNAEAAVARLKRDIEGDGDETLSVLEEAAIESKQYLEDATQQLETARTDAAEKQKAVDDFGGAGGGGYS